MLVWMDGKGPNEDANFTLDWTTRLNGDSITSSSWAIVGTDVNPESPITLQIASNPAPSFSATMTQVWLTGGALGIVYILRNTISTASGQNPLTEEVELPIRNR